MKRIKSFFKILGMLVLCASFTGCGMNGNIDDYAVNTGYGDYDTVKSSSGVSKDSIKVGVIHLSDPAEAADIHIRMILELWVCSRISDCRTVRL